MFEILPESTETCLGFKVSGKVTVPDYEERFFTPDQIDQAWQWASS